MDCNPFYSGLIDSSYREFSRKIVNDDALPVLGIRIPQLRKLAKEMDCVDFPIICHEDVLLKGLIISSIRKPFAERRILLDGLLPHLSAWDHADIIGSSMKVRKGEEEEAFGYFSSLLASGRVFVRRIGIVYLFSHRRLYPAHDILAIIAQADSDEYYISMAVAWGLQVFWKDGTETGPYLDKVSDATRRRAEQKIRDSIRESRTRRKQG